MKRKSVFIAWLAAFALTVCGCSSSVPSQQPTLPDDTNANVDQAPQTDYEALYRNVLDRFYLLISDPDGHTDEVTGSTGAWEVANYMEHDEALRVIGYTISDISGDGIPELLIGEVSDSDERGTQIYSVYAIVDEAPVCILEGWARNCFRAMENGRFFYVGSGGAAYSAFGTYAIAPNGAELICEDFYFTDLIGESYDKVGCYHNTTGVWEAEGSEYLGELDDTFWQLEDELDMQPMSIALTPFAAYQYSDEVSSASTVRALWADEFTLSQEYDEFTADTSDVRSSVIFTTDGVVKNFKFLALSVSGADSDGNLSFDTEELYAQDALSHERPFLVNMTFFGDLPSYGISYEDEGGQTHSLALEISGMDGSLVLSQF